MNIYSQRDIKWGKDKMGNSGLELEDYGCLCTSISMLDGRTPKEVNKIFSKGGAYNSNGILNHTIASKLLGLEYTGFSNTPSFFPIIAEVDMSPSPGKQQHFVVQESPESIIDPWTGLRRSTKAYPILSYRKYKNLKEYSGVPTKEETLEKEVKSLKDSVKKLEKNVKSLEGIIEEKDSEIERLLNKIGVLNINNEQYLKDIEDQEEVLRDLKLQIMELKKMNDSYKEIFEKPAPSDMLSIFKKIFRK